MKGKVLFLLSMLWLGQAARAATPPDAADQKAIIARMRVAALSYADHLQGFLCTEFLTRTVDPSGTGKHWKLLETQELELGYISHQEHSKTLKVNGKTTNLDKRVKRAYWMPGGEFGSALLGVFEPRVAAEFEWDHEETSEGRRTCVFRFHVPVTTSSYVIQADQDHVRMALRGAVTAVCETGSVTRLQVETEPASVKRGGRDIAIGMQLDVRYGTVHIAEREYLLPLTATETAPFGKTLTKVEIRFDQYRKYDSSSNIVFDDGK